MNGPDLPYRDIPRPRSDDWGQQTAKLNAYLFEASDPDRRVKPKTVKPDEGGKDQTPQLGSDAPKPESPSPETDVQEPEQGQQADVPSIPEAARRTFGLNQINQTPKSPDLDVSEL